MSQRLTRAHGWVLHEEILFKSVWLYYAKQIHGFLPSVNSLGKTAPFRILLCCYGPWVYVCVVGLDFRAETRSKLHHNDESFVSVYFSLPTLHDAFNKEIKYCSFFSVIVPWFAVFTYFLFLKASNLSGLNVRRVAFNHLNAPSLPLLFQTH